METNETGKFFAWPISWLQQAQWPVRWQNWRLLEREDRSPADVAQVDTLSLASLVDEIELFDEVEMVELTQMAEDLAQLITPVFPDPQFRTDLKETLLAAHIQQGTRSNFFPPLTDYSLRPWQVIATVPVVVGVAALIWRYSQRSTGQSLEVA
jgi:hypothetical protein